LRFAARGFGGHAGGEVIGSAHLDVRTQLFVEVTIQAFLRNMPRRRVIQDTVHLPFVRSGELEYVGDCLREPLPVLFFGGELLTTAAVRR